MKQKQVREKKCEHIDSTFVGECLKCGRKIPKPITILPQEIIMSIPGDSVEVYRFVQFRDTINQIIRYLKTRPDNKV